MKRVIIKYGGLGGLIMVGFFMVSYLFMKQISMSTQELLGFASIFIGLSFVFFGIKSYRDKELNGQISFGRALGTGVLIALVAATLLGLFDTLYVSFAYPEFYEEYYEVQVQAVREQYTGQELTNQLTEMEAMKKLAMQPWFTFVLMFLNVFVLGFIVSLISAFVLRKSN